MKYMVKQLFSYYLFLTIPLYLTAMDQGKTQEDDTRYIQKHLKKWAPGQKVTAIEELKGGLGGSRLYTINFEKEEPYVARLLVGYFAKEPEWQKTEIETMQAAAQAGVGPRIIAAQAQDGNNPIGYAVMQKINVLPITEIPWDNKSTYHSLGEFLHKMHTQPSTIKVNKDSIYGRVNRITTRMQEMWKKNATDGLFDQLSQVTTYFKKTEPIWHSKERTQLVHGDLLLGNLLYDGTFVAVDWEQSRLVADPLFDVALVYDCLVPKEYRKNFMQGYCSQDKPPSDDHDRLKIMRFMAGCFVGLAYGASDPVLFANQFRERKEKQINLNHALHGLMRDGLKRNTTEDCVNFGSLLFMQGYRWLEGKRLPVLEALLKSKKGDPQEK